MTTTTHARNWVPIVAWAQLGLGLTALVAVVASPLVAVVVGAAVALIALACRALARASRKLDRILAEELDHQ